MRLLSDPPLTCLMRSGVEVATSTFRIHLRGGFELKLLLVWVWILCLQSLQSLQFQLNDGVPQPHYMCIGAASRPEVINMSCDTELWVCRWWRRSKAKVKGHRARLTCTNMPKPLMPPLKKTRCGFHGVSLNEEGQDAIVYVLGCHSFNTEWPQRVCVVKMFYIIFLIDV